MAYSKKRNRMVDEQLIPRGISSREVIEVFRTVPRHVFVSQPYVEEAYDDHALPIGHGQTISQPYMVALMTELLDLKRNEKVLEIGTGSGYQAAVLSMLCNRVYTVEKNEQLLEKARGILASCGYGNISFKCGDGTAGWPEEPPFDAIMVTAASPDTPEPLKEQLAEGGRMVIPVGEKFSQILLYVKKNNGVFVTEAICGCVFVPLVGQYGWRATA